VEIAGLNRGWRKVLIDAIARDPAWKGGDYVDQPPGLRAAVGILAIVLSSPLQLQKALPTRPTAASIHDFGCWECQQRSADHRGALRETRNDYPCGRYTFSYRVTLFVAF
jgi:homoserine acetyltransferase